MHHNIQESPLAFELKRKGNFEQALKAYANEYANSLISENSFIADICFDQMFDCCLLKQLKEERHFATKEQLLEAIRMQLVEVLHQQETYDENFKKRFDSCRRKLFPRGRATGEFSVDVKWLLEKVKSGEI